MKDQWCRHGQHFRDRDEFRTQPNGKIAPMCMLCESKRKPPTSPFTIARPEPDGVDIDAIHYNKRYAVRK